MFSRADRRLALGLAVITACLTLVPYVAAGEMAPAGARFAGFLVNPLDGFSYLAKMRQGMAGAWTFVLPYAADPGQPVPLFLFYLLLGHVQMWSHLPALWVFHAFRLVGAFAMFACALRWLEGALDSRRAVWAGYVPVLFGGGLGWLALPFGIAASDLTIPESVPFLTALVNPHFPFAAAVLFLLMDALGPRDMAAGARVIVAVVCGMALGVLLPFIVVTAVAVPAVWLAAEAWIDRAAGARRAWLRDRWLAWIGVCAGAGPWVVYGVWLTRAHPVLRVWHAQNQTPSPSPLAYLFGFAVPLIVILAGWRQARPHRTPGGRLALVWVLVVAAMLYMPGLMQRRLTLGLALPLAALAGVSLTAALHERRRWALAVVTAVLVGVPSLLIVVAAGLTSVARGAAISVIRDSDWRAMEWSAANLPADSLVLASPLTGNRLPAFGDVRVLYGHSFETPYAADTEAVVLGLLNWGGAAEEARQDVRSRGIDYVYIGGLERGLIGGVRWWESLPVVYRDGDVTIYRVSTP